MQYKFKTVDKKIIIKEFKNDEELIKHLLESSGVYEDMEEIEEDISPARLYQYIESSKINFAILSAERSERTDDENINATKKLIADIKKLDLWYTPVKGGYVEVNDKGERIAIDGENSFIIPNISKNDAIHLGVKYNQDTILYKDSNNKTFDYIITNKRLGKIGDVDMSFKLQSGRDNMDVSSGENIDYFTRLHKSNKPNLKIGFKSK